MNIILKKAFESDTRSHCTALQGVFFRIIKILLGCIGLASLISCSPVSMPESNQYQISSYSSKQWAKRPIHATLLVTIPEAVAGYQTDEMLYIKKPYQLESFAKNAWVNPPANMLYPLLTQSIQRAGYFHAVSSSPYAQDADYRLDTQVLHLEQNFFHKPSVLSFSIKVVLTRISDNKIIASRIISQNIPCAMDTPYGGVLAANKASLLTTEAVTRFVVSSIKRD
jgi:cholesterol transport system auxiliary component